MSFTGWTLPAASGGVARMTKRRHIALAAAIASLGAAALAAPAVPHADARAIKAGRALFAANCASCHGIDGKGAAGHHVPDLTDDRWLFGGEDVDTFLIRPSDIATTIRHGIRADDPQTRNLAAMPALGVGHSLEPDEVAAVTEYVLKLGGQPHDEGQIALGKETFEDEGGCYDCHTVQGWGDPATGSADLTRPRTYLYGSDRAAIAATVREGRAGVSPTFGRKLSPQQIHDISVYVLNLSKSHKYI
ncbi:c-type cytochrome [Novosphingobium olei]|nr:c-type cytochrome [Novosphingobium olei]